ncbi:MULTISPECIES: GntR family transcriptional regulator [unclassified Kitasatospora]|uniref:GntR family transcriptional regulator n=1 Tax=unclassified Kitasatospora TaxID=2633591 RepID=UPI001ADF34A6|nr:GntR family transcriptional regulator [Kitasatospora sp. RG8]MBP0453471.1 GntR family transcriptional regulator [Kitasatospora sp. RG8]
MVEWTGEKSAYRQVADDLCVRIAAGEFASNGRIPSLAALQTQYEVTPTVARAAVARLKEAGLVVSHQGKATSLASDAVAKAAARAGEAGQLRQELAEVRDELRALAARVAELEAR